ncbi:hypothetical protein VP01_6837g1, partial [Puccinia sorghi]
NTNLDEDSSSLHNSTHQIAALTTFTELGSTPAYAYLKIDPEMAQDMSFLIPAYNHFVHYLQLDKYKKELKEKGKVAQEANNKKISKNRERLRDERRDFAILHKFPQRYQEILELITAHSDDKFVEFKGIYKIKTIPYHSNNPNRFFRRLDSLMKDAAGQNPLAKMSCHQTLGLPKKPEMSNFKLAPKGLPINFCSPKWYHKLLPLKDTQMENWLIQLSPRNIAEEESASEDTPMLPRIHFLRKVILAGSLYNDEEDSDFIASDDQEEEVEGGGSDDKEDDEYDKAQDNIVMKTIPEGEEEW